MTTTLTKTKVVVFPDNQADHSSSRETRDLLSEFAASVNRLPSEQRVALELRKYHGLGYDEIAAILDISAGVAQENVHQALRGLREHMKDRL